MLILIQYETVLPRQLLMAQQSVLLRQQLVILVLEALVLALQTLYLLRQVGAPLGADRGLVALQFDNLECLAKWLALS